MSNNLSFNPKNLVRLKSPRHCLLLFILTLFLTSVSLAQENSFAQQEMPKDAEPPPIKVISKEEREQLSRETKIKNRTKLALELMKMRLDKAEQFGAKNQYKEMFGELGRFHALVDNALWFLNRNDTGGGSILYNFKRLEMGLREFLPRLELIRRDLPLNYEYYVRGLIMNVRDARSKAVDPLFSDTVLPENSTGN